MAFSSVAAFSLQFHGASWVKIGENSVIIKLNGQVLQLIWPAGVGIVSLPLKQSIERMQGKPADGAMP